MNVPISHALLTLGILAVKVTLLLLAAGGCTLLLRNASAAMRHLVWTASLIGVIVMPMLCLTLPHLNILISRPVTPIALPASKTAPASAARQLSSMNISKPGVAVPQLRKGGLTETVWTHRGRPSVAAGAYRLSLVFVLPIVWAAGFLAVLAQFAIGWHRITRIGHSAVSPNEATARIAEQVRDRLEVRPIRLLMVAKGTDVAVPMTWGTLQPVVMLPPQSDEWSEECLRAALLHEMAHIKRWDWSAQVVSRLACAFYWWHPFVWLAAKQAREEAERSCDDIAMEAGMKAADYAQRLVDVVRSIPHGATARTAAIPMARPSEMEGRLQAILARGRRRSPVNSRWLAAVAVTAGTMLSLLASLQLVVQAQSIGAAVGVSGRTISPMLPARALPKHGKVEGKRSRTGKSSIKVAPHIKSAAEKKTIADKKAGRGPIQDLIQARPLTGIVDRFVADMPNKLSAHTYVAGLAHLQAGGARRIVSAASGLNGASAPASRSLQAIPDRSSANSASVSPLKPTVSPHNISTSNLSLRIASVEEEASIVAAQERLRRATAGYQAGINTKSDVCEAEIAVAEARLQSSVARNDFSDLKPDLEDLERQRLQLLTYAQARFAVGVTDRRELNAARAALESVSVRMSLYNIVAIRSSDLADETARYNSGVVTSQERDHAEDVLLKAERAFIDSSSDQ